MAIAHSSDCAIWNPNASTEKACDCGALLDPVNLAGSGHTQASSPLESWEGRRTTALELAVEAFAHIENPGDATYIVDTAKIFETYLKGE